MSSLNISFFFMCLISRAKKASLYLDTKSGGFFVGENIRFHFLRQFTLGMGLKLNF